MELEEEERVGCTCITSGLGLLAGDTGEGATLPRPSSGLEARRNAFSNSDSAASSSSSSSSSTRPSGVSPLAIVVWLTLGVSEVVSSLPLPPPFVSVRDAEAVPVPVVVEVHVLVQVAEEQDCVECTVCE